MKINKRFIIEVRDFKHRTAKSGDFAEHVRLITTEIGHQLKEGDQIILGESALIEFSYEN